MQAFPQPLAKIRVLGVWLSKMLNNGVIEMGLGLTLYRILTMLALDAYINTYCTVRSTC